MNNEFSTLGLYNHNANSYRLVRQAFDKGQNIVGIVHATGTGKSYNALQLAYDNQDKKIVYIVPSTGIIEHIEKIIESNPNLSREKDFSKLEFRTYQSFINLSKEEISSIEMDMIVLDEFHHIGAPVWGARIETLLETHPDLKVFGMTAYTVRDRGTSYERDMAESDSDELFSDNIVSRYDLCDAMIDGVLPKPIYKSAYVNLIGMEQELERKVASLNSTSREYQEYMSILNDVKKRISEAPSMPDIVRQNIRPDGKYIYFCPPTSEDGTNDIETIKKEAMEWFKKYISEKDIVFYSTTSDMGKEGKRNRDAFYEDITLDGDEATGKLRVMFAINQYNEGIHAPNVDGVIMGRGTTSDIVYFEQLGRALAVRGETKNKIDEYMNYSLEELKEICEQRAISLDDSVTKEEIIERLVAPIIIDLTNNFDFIKDLENNLKDRVKLIQDSDKGTQRDIAFSDASFDIELANKDLYDMLKYVMDRLTMSWDDIYGLAQIYYEKNGDLDISRNFKTLNGYEYDENGLNLGEWLHNQRNLYKNGSLLPERQERLESINIKWNIASVISNEKWEKGFNLAQVFYENNGHLIMDQSFRTIDGIHEVKPNDPNYDKAFRLGIWLNHQRTRNTKNKLKKERKKRLEEIGIIWNLRENKWYEKYYLIKKHYQHYNTTLISENFRTIDGIHEITPNDPDYDKAISLRDWEDIQRREYKSGRLSDGRIKLLEEIGFRWNPQEDKWKENFELYKTYVDAHGNGLITQRFRTIDGIHEIKPDDPEYEKAAKLGSWVRTQRTDYRNEKLSKEKIKMLEEIGIIWDVKEYKRQQKLSELQILLEQKEQLEEQNKSLDEQIDDVESGLGIGNEMKDNEKSRI